MSIYTNADRFCGEVSLSDATSCSRPTLNQTLAGLPNARTKISPPIVAPIAELSYWGDNPGIHRTQLNTRTTKYPKQSGWETCAIPQQPGIYTMSETRQPINSTNGIAIVPQFPEHTYNIRGSVNQIFFDTNNAISYVLETPNEVLALPTPPPSSAPVLVTRATDYCEPNIANVYDPRFTGYGPSDRCFVDECLGQTRYFYDDIDAIRMPNYITRNKLDSCLTFGDSYGDVNAGNLSLDDVRASAEKSWVDNSLSFRENMMLSLMRKKNEEMVQKRVAPKYTMF